MKILTLSLLGAGLVLTVLISAACGQTSEPLDATGVEPAPKVPSGVIPAGAPMIDQNNLKFSPNKLTVKAGNVIYFRNDETAIHTVTVNGRNVTGDMRRNDVHSWAIDLPGVYKLTCDYHPQMKATLTVE